MKRRFAGAYLSSVISISLVLVLVGIASLLVVNARNVSDYFKESLQVSVLMKQEIKEAKAEKYIESIKDLPFVKNTRLITREEGTRELEEMLGKDFLKVFESSPVPVSVDVYLKAGYVEPDSLKKVTAILSESPLVDEVSCQVSLVEALNANLAKISLILSVFIILLLFVSFVLIGNTVRISVFDRRFIIHTMKLVGATPGFIQAPFIKDAAVQGLVSAGLTLCLMFSGMLMLKHSFSQLYEVFAARSIAVTSLVIIFCGVAICVVSTLLTTRRLLKMDKNDLYY